MKASVLRYVRSTTRALGLALVLLVVFAYAGFAEMSTWRGDWWWGYNSVAQAVPLAVVLVAFVTGWEAGATGSGLQSLLARRPVKRWMVPSLIAAPPLGAGLVAFTVAVVGVAVVTLGADGSIDPRSPLVFLAHALMMGVAAMLGLFTGRWLASPFAAGTAALLAAAMLFFTPGPMPVFGFFGASTAIIGATPSTTFYLVDIAVLLVVVLALAAPHAMASRALFAAGFGAAGAAWVAASLLGPVDQFVPGDEEADRCGGSPVRVCVYPGYDRLIGPASQQIDRLLARAESEGVPRSSFPDQYRMLGGSRPEVGEGYLLVGDTGLRDGEIDPGSLAVSMSSPLWCDAMFSDTPPLRLLDDRQLVYDWLLLLQGAVPERVLVERHPALAVSPAQRAQLVDDALISMLTCDDT